MPCRRILFRVVEVVAHHVLVQFNVVPSPIEKIGLLHPCANLLIDCLCFIAGITLLTKRLLLRYGNHMAGCEQAACCHYNENKLYFLFHFLPFWPADLYRQLSKFFTCVLSDLPLLPQLSLTAYKAARRIVIPGTHGAEHILHGSSKKQPLFRFRDTRQQNRHSAAMPVGYRLPAIQNLPCIAEYFPKAAAFNPVRKLSYPQQDIRKFCCIILKPGLFRRRSYPINEDTLYLGGILNSRCT